MITCELFLNKTGLLKEFVVTDRVDFKSSNYCKVLVFVLANGFNLFILKNERQLEEVNFAE